MTLTSCAGRIATSDDAVQRPTFPAGTQRSFDLFLGEEAGRLGLAHQKIRNRCLADAGFPQNLDTMLARSGHIAPSLVVTAGSFGWTSEEEARRRGFGRDRSAQPARIVSFDPAYDRSLKRCEEQVWGDIGADAREVWDSYRELGNTLTREYFAALSAVMPRDLTEATLNCLIGKGHPVVDREAFLADGNPRYFGIVLGALAGGADKWVPQRRPGTIQIGPATPARRYLPTAAESRFAVDFYRCDQQTRRIARILALTEEIERQVIAKHESALAELNPRLTVLVRKASAMAGTG